MTSSQFTAKAIIVLGMHRSGTSAITRVLNLLGAELGSELMPPAAGNNASGFWEHVGVVEIHDALLRALDRSWHDLQPLPSGWLNSDAARDAKTKLLELVRRDFSGVPLWAVKDPRLCRLLPLWHDVLAELGIELCALNVVRHPDEVASSLLKRDQFPLQQGRLLWMEYVADAERGSRDCPRSFVAYEDLLSDWRYLVDRIGAELSIEWPRAPETVAIQVDAFLDSGQRHHSFGSGVAEGLPPLIKNVYAALRAMADGCNSPNSLLNALAEYRSVADVFINGFAAALDGDRARRAAFVATMASDANERSKAMLLVLRELGALVDISVKRASLPQGDAAILYWSQDDSSVFSEAHKVTLEGRDAIRDGRLVFQLPMLSKISRLRIDPSVHPGRFDFVGLRIDQVVVEDFSERVVGVNQLRAPSRGAEHVAIISLEDDPHFEIDVDGLEVDWSQGVAVEVHVLRQELPEAGFDDVWQRFYQDIVDVALRRHADRLESQFRTELQAVAHAASLSVLEATERLLVQGRAAGVDMLNRMERLSEINRQNISEQFGPLTHSVQVLSELGDGYAAELAEVRSVLKAMDENRRRTLLHRLRSLFRKR